MVDPASIEPEFASREHEQAGERRESQSRTLMSSRTDERHTVCTIRCSRGHRRACHRQAVLGATANLLESAHALHCSLDVARQPSRQSGPRHQQRGCESTSHRICSHRRRSAHTAASELLRRRDESIQRCDRRHERIRRLGESDGDITGLHRYSSSRWCWLSLDQLLLRWYGCSRFGHDESLQDSHRRCGGRIDRRQSTLHRGARQGRDHGVGGWRRWRRGRRCTRALGVLRCRSIIERFSCTVRRWYRTAFARSHTVRFTDAGRIARHGDQWRETHAG